jgi:hypothetical protein
LWVRHRAVEDPAESVRYEMFYGGMAALAWRQRNAVPIGSDGVEGRPEVSRVLMGPVQLLTPEVAVAICRTGLPDAIGPRPGEVVIGGTLPPIDPAELTRLACDQAAELDRLAVNETGLYRVIAAALTDLDKALSVQLPQRIIAMPPQDGSQGPLLWGLRRTVWPLLGRDSGRRGWSFSTYEPPLGDMDTGALADIVFRAQQAVQLALSTRRELLVRPQEPIEPPATIRYQDFAGLLVDAYRYMGGEELARHLDAVGNGGRSVDERIEDARAMLCSVLPAAAVSVPRAAENSAPAESPVYAESAAPAEDDGASAESAAPAEDDGASAESPAHAENAAFAAIDSPEGVTPPEAMIPSASSISTGFRPEMTAQSPLSPAPSPTTAPPSREPSAAPPWVPKGPAMPFSALPSPPRTSANRQEPTGATMSHSVSSLLDQLYTGPAAPEFESALRLLRVGTFPDRPADRAVARQRIAERDWYLPVLLQYDSAHYDDTLEAIFRVAVIPDLGRPEVRKELARWAGESAAPPPVIKALNVAAQSWADAPELMRQALERPLGQRWLTEHGIYTRPSAYAAAAFRGQGAKVAGGSHPQRTLLDGRLRGDPVAMLALFCAVLFALLVLALVH